MEAHSAKKHAFRRSKLRAHGICSNCSELKFYDELFKCGDPETIEGCMEIFCGECLYDMEKNGFAKVVIDTKFVKRMECPYCYNK